MATRRSDIVLSMTLAETFLLFLFLIWLGDVVAKSGEAPPTDPSRLAADNARLTDENARLSAELKSATSDIQRLQLIVDAFRKALGITEPITSPEQVGPAAKAAGDAARRGAPKCDDDNLFARVTVLDGVTTLLVAAPPSVLAKVATTTRINVALRATLSDEADVEGVLRAVSSYAQAKGCRFDYTLTYRTKGDYYDARERFERGRLFYAAGLVAEAGGRR